MKCSLACDPTQDDGCLVVIPVVFGKGLSAERPHFVVTRSENRAVFDHYWAVYRATFKRGTPINPTVTRRA